MATFTTNVRIGSELHAFVGKVGTTDEQAAKDAVADLIDNLKPGGHAALLDNGTRIWVEDIAVRIPGRQGGDAYIWDRSYNRVRHRRVRVTIARDGRRSEHFLRHIYKSI